MMLGGKIGARSSGPAGCRVAGLSGGAGGVGRSATMLYQALGILSSSRTNFFLYSLMIYLLSKRDSGADARLMTPWMGGREDHGAVVGGAGRARAGCREWARYARQSQRRRGREVLRLLASVVVIVGGIVPREASVGASVAVAPGLWALSDSLAGGLFGRGGGRRRRTARQDRLPQRVRRARMGKQETLAVGDAEREQGIELRQGLDALRRQGGAAARRHHAAQSVELGDAVLGARDLEEGVGAVELALQGPAGEELVADHPVVVQADDGLVDAGDLRLADHTLELRAQAVLDFAALLLDAAGGALDGFEQGALEAHLG